MSDGNRGAGDKALAGLFVVLAIAGAVWVIYGVGSLSGKQEGRSIEAAARHEANGKQQAVQTCSSEPISRRTECVYDAIAAAEDAKRAEQDLQAQQGMHFWAVSMVLVGLLQTGVAGAALWFLREDLRQNRKSTEAQLRAYISVGKVQSDDFADYGVREKTIHLPLINSGPTPVLNWDVEWYWQVATGTGRSVFDFVYERFREHYSKIKRPEGNYTFGATQEKTIPLLVHIPQPWFAKVMEKECRFYLIGLVNYVDIFGKSRTSEFFYCYNVGGPVQFGQMPWHNRIT